MDFNIKPSNEIGIDFETASELDLSVCGSRRYASHSSTRIICLAWEDRRDKTKGLWRPGQPVPADLAKAVRERRCFAAHNAGFDRAIWGNLFPLDLPPLGKWTCSAVRASVNGLPRNLDDAAFAAGLGYAKDPEAAKALKKMCKISRGVFNDTPELRKLVEGRCVTDVTFMLDLMERTAPLDLFECRWWMFDQECNDTGIPVDIKSAQRLQANLPGMNAHLIKRLNVVTKYELSTLTSTKAVMEWCAAKGVNLPNVQRQTIEELLDNPNANLPGEVRGALSLKRYGALAAPKKIKALLERAELDPSDDSMGVLRDTYVCNGAHTGRDTSKGFQTQNMKRETASLDQLKAAVEAVDENALDAMLALDEEPLDIVGKCVRLLIKARRGHKLIVGDFSKIETCVLFWLAQDSKGLRKLHSGVDLYLDMASRIYGEPVSKADKARRQLGKTAILGLGFGCGVDTFHEMLRVQYGIIVPKQLAVDAVRAYRETYRTIVNYWYALEGAVKNCIVEKTGKQLGRLKIAAKNGLLVIQLPSDRKLRYRNPCIDPYGRITFDGVRSQSRTYGKCSTWGGTLTENVVQAIANDLLRQAALVLRAKGYTVIMRSHDELVAHEPEELIDVPEFQELMELKHFDGGWWKGLPISVEAASMDRYSK